MPATVLLITGRNDARALLPAQDGLSDLRISHPQVALRSVAEHRAQGLPVVLVVDTTSPGVQPLLSDCAARYPEVPLILATPPGENPRAPALPAVRRPAGSPALLDAIEVAGRAAVQQARVRTTLDRFNVRLRARHAPGAWDERQHRRLLLSELYLAGIFGQASDAMFITDRGGAVVLWNRAAEATFGVPSADVCGQAIRTIGPHRGGAELHAAIAALSDESPCGDIHLSLNSAGGARTLHVSLSLIRTEDGTGVAVSGIGRDVTEREALLRSVQEHADALAISNQHKEQFLAVLSHELRTPLNIVLGWSRILQTMPFDPPRVREAADRIARNAEVQHRLVNDLLEFAGIAAGKLRLHLAPANLVAVVRESVDALRPHVAESGLALTEDYGEEVFLPLDAQRIRQVVMNLLGNAIKFTPRGGQIRVGVHRSADSVVLTVSDTGTGFGPDFLPYLFEAFHQRDACHAGSQGLGLGLTISRRIVELHRGTIHAHSGGEGAGATFTVLLPADPPDSSRRAFCSAV